MFYVNILFCFLFVPHKQQTCSCFTLFYYLLVKGPCFIDLVRFLWAEKMNGLTYVTLNNVSIGLVQQNFSVRNKALCNIVGRLLYFTLNIFSNLNQ
jgi:hypothetical protein